MKKGTATFLSSILIVGAIVYLAYTLSNNPIKITTSSPVQQLNGAATNTISVSEQGIVYASPDILYVNITVSEDAKTTKDALDQTNKKIAQVRQILKSANIKEENITSTNVSINPKYNRNDGTQKFEGYTATHDLKVKIASNKGNFESAGSIIDEVAQIDKVMINSLQYDIDNKEPMVAQAREKAYELAQKKAQQLADLGTVKLGKPISINESTSYDSYPQPYYNKAMAEGAVAMDAG